MRQAVTNFILKAYTLSKGKALVGQKVAQQSVHWTLGTAARRDGVPHASRQAFFWLRVFSAPKQSPRPPQRHASRTQTVGRLIVKRNTIKICLAGGHV
jgi:hypothetical protein